MKDKRTLSLFKRSLWSLIFILFLMYAAFSGILLALPLEFFVFQLIWLDILQLNLLLWAASGACFVASTIQFKNQLFKYEGFVDAKNRLDGINPESENEK